MMIRSLCAAALVLGCTLTASAQQHVKVLVAFHSVSGNTEKFAHAVAEGARRVEASVVTIKKIEDVQPADLQNADALIVGSPTHWSNMSTPIKAFIDSWPDMV